MSLLLVSFIAGFLTVLAPCSLFLLPTIVVGSTSEKASSRPWLIVISLGASVFLFSLLIKGTTLALAIPDEVWSYVSGALLLVFGLTLLFPHAWELVAMKFKFTKSQNLLEKSSEQSGKLGSILLGASLGPVFTTCSPTFALLLAVILPKSLAQGALNIAIFVIGMMIPFLLIGIGGQKIVKKFRFLANPNGWFRKTLGIILLLVAIMVITGYQKVIEKALIENGYLGPVQFEQSLLE